MNLNMPANHQDPMEGSLEDGEENEDEELSNCCGATISQQRCTKCGESL